MARQWILNSQDGFEASLEYQENIKIPTASELAPNEVLVKLHAASLNYRELVIAGPIVRCLRDLEGNSSLTSTPGNQRTHLPSYRALLRRCGRSCGHRNLCQGLPAW